MSYSLQKQTGILKQHKHQFYSELFVRLVSLIPLFYLYACQFLLLDHKLLLVIEMFALGQMKLLFQLGYLLAAEPKAVGYYSGANLALKYSSMDHNMWEWVSPD